MFSWHLPQLVGSISFRCFGISCFVCIVLPFVYISNLPSFASTFWFISSSSIVIFSSIAFFLFLSLHVPAFFLCFIILAFFRRFFLSVFPVEFPIQVLIFSSCILRGSRFSHKLIFLVHRLVNLIRLYNLLIYMLVLDLFFSVSVLTILHSMFLSDGKVVFFQFIILFKFSLNLFFVRVCSVLFGVVFLFSEVGCSFRLVYSCVSILSVSILNGSIIVLFSYCFVHYLFSGVFLVFQGQKTNLSLLLY